MAYFKDLNSLFAKINSDIDNSLKTDVAFTVIEKLKGNIKTEVYAKYTPTQYNRQYDNGGLLDDDNFSITPVGNNAIHIRSTRSDGNKDVAAIVEYGFYYDWTNSRIAQMQPYPRPFHGKTESDLIKDKEHVEAMRKGLIRRGYKLM